MSDVNNAQEISTFFFPLRTNVSYFESAEEYSLLPRRVKQASLLYDELVFEGGIYNATVWEAGVMDQWMPADKLSYTDLVHMRERFKPTDVQSALFIQPDGGQPVPLFSGPVIRKFHCEFHSLLKEIDGDNLDWLRVETFDLTPIGKKRTQIASEHFEKLYTPAEENLDVRVKKTILKNIGRDFVISTEMGADCSVNSIVAPILYERAQFQEAPGFVALHIAVTDFSELGWDVISDLRREESWIHFRRKMKQIELEARTALNVGEYDEARQIYIVAQRFIQEILREVAELQPRVGEAIGNIALDLFLGTVPVVGTGMSVLRSAIKIDESRKSWTAALLRLRSTRGAE